MNSCLYCNNYIPKKRLKRRKAVFCSKYCQQMFWQNNNRDRANFSNKLWIKRNPEKRKKASDEYRKRNLGKYANYATLRSRACEQARPEWLSEDQRWMIDETYRLRDLRNKLNSGSVKWEVDHIVPLRGGIVCGLHVPWNLQVVPMKVNRAKPRRFVNG